MGYVVTLKKNEEKRILAGNGWVYANEVASISGKDKNGSLATVVSSAGRFIGKGYINHLSKILVRIFVRDERSDEEVIKERLLEAVNLRKRLGFSTCYRAVYAESDLLPGLIVDKYGEALSVQFLTLGMDMRKDFIVECLKDIFAPRAIIERSDVAVRQKEGLPLKKGVIYGENISRIETEENGLKLSIDLIDGQKTGYFLDQKENRFALRRYAKDKNVLDCFCNAGGFGLNAAAAGAKSVTFLDISPVALSEVKRNAALNGITNIETVECDVFEKLREYKAEKKKFDLIVLDPPAFCKSGEDVAAALKGYKDINVLAMKLLADDGILVSSSCSHFVTPLMFKRMLAESAASAGKRAKIIEERGQCPDHPILLGADESAYLKFVVLSVCK
ncbi:MAG TPA: rRNA large subunit methyltransferase I [Clostridiales bacterium]|nr:rRNA large subunit methyltransferase I [Clostridiales bacterium]